MAVQNIGFHKTCIFMKKKNKKIFRLLLSIRSHWKKYNVTSSKFVYCFLKEKCFSSFPVVSGRGLRLETGHCSRFCVPVARLECLEEHPSVMPACTDDWQRPGTGWHLRVVLGRVTLQGPNQPGSALRGCGLWGLVRCWSLPCISTPPQHLDTHCQITSCWAGKEFSFKINLL